MADRATGFAVAANVLFAKQIRRFAHRKHCGKRAAGRDGAADWVTRAGLDERVFLSRVWLMRERVSIRWLVAVVRSARLRRRQRLRRPGFVDLRGRRRA